MYVDSHCHIDGTEFDADRVEVIARARSAGIEAILVIGTGNPNEGEHTRAVRMVEVYRADVARGVYGDDAVRLPRLYATVGIHPHDARHFDDRVEVSLEVLAREQSEIIAIGEIGLDYHYDNSPREMQRNTFERQIRLARKLDLPIVIHTREAAEDTMAMLEAELRGWERAGGCGVMHCFNGDEEMAERALRLGLLISFAGNLTFSKAEELRIVARQIPLDRILIETDAPYLSPVPYRGKRNEPAHVVGIAQTLATLHETNVETIARQTTANFYDLFHIAHINANSG